MDVRRRKMEVGIARARGMIASKSEPQLRPFSVKMMRSNDCFHAGLRLFVAVLGVLLSANAGLTASAIVRDGNTIQLGDVAFKLDGIEAPEFDQICIDDHADPWTCGIEARDQLSKLIADRPVHCDDLGPDKTSKKRHLGVCSVEGQTASLNQQLLRQGLALNVAGSASARFAADALSARDARTGLWKGCFIAPREFRAGKKDGALIGAACRSDRDKEIRAALFPEDFAAPAGCNIKGKFAVRARVTFNLGIYHLRGCPSYPAITEPDRWFCSEDDAQAAGFRKAFNCRAPRGK
jgi:endonuclease YncB( thermonuclease family)